ncbi:helix-turn-helix domain-containing protein [Parvibaculum sp.]|uniref:TetR/AcrR family transcriptional regulator n=1 Tax=Parvibaculum sp. TaxID=2024848 RepID=UPI002B982E39|nr:helix-turn-helix domain-containing protein [Parvibaculum sp.]HUD51618.1 helix-turn-helix domain-containing protein [Parvibaculum sp.]
MTGFKPKKWPKQARSKASFDAVIEAAARLLAESGYEALTTNRIAERAGVSIGTLYEFFPDKETIVAVLAERQMARIVERMRKAFADIGDIGPWRGVIHLTEAAVAVMAEDRDVHRALLRQIPFVAHLPAVTEARMAMLDLAQQVRIAAGDRLDLPMPEEDAWLIAQMLYNTILEIALLDVPPAKKKQFTRELARLTYRMAVGRDPMV